MFEKMNKTANQKFYKLTSSKQASRVKSPKRNLRKTKTVSHTNQESRKLLKHANLKSNIKLMNQKASLGAKKKKKITSKERQMLIEQLIERNVQKMEDQIR
jgi:hypothetical protein